MPIAFDAATQSSNTTFSHICTGTDLFLKVYIQGSYPPSDNISGVTYAGVSMTRQSYLAISGRRSDFVYTLIAPATGANNVVISLSSGDIGGAQVTSYTGVKQTSQPTGVVTNNGNSATQTVSVTTTDDNSWVIGGFNNPDNTTAAAGTILRTTGAAAATDKNGASSPPGSYSLDTTSVSSDVWTASGMAIAPVSATTTFLPIPTLPLLGVG